MNIEDNENDKYIVDNISKGYEQSESGFQYFNKKGDQTKEVELVNHSQNFSDFI